MGVLSLRLDEELERLLAQEARRGDVTRSELARQALASFLRERERQRFLDEIARAARALDPDESRTLAEEALPAGNEALLASEPRAKYGTRQRPSRRAGSAKR